MARGATHLPLDKKVSQITHWWYEADAAIKAGHPSRARRFLRWILACNPDEEEAWLWLARLAVSSEEEITYLQRAYAFHPNSSRVQTALREARSRHLAASVGTLKPKRLVPHCLPGERSLPHTCSASQEYEIGTPAGTNGNDTNRDEPPHPAGPPSRKKADLAAWIAFLLPLMVYLLTACTTVYNLDSAEFSAAVHVLGIVRATGYPLYMLLGKAFTILIPIGDVGFRLNVMSALCAAGTSALLYHLAHRLVRQRAAALGAALVFAFSYYFWAQAVVAEVYALHTLLMASLLLLLLHWKETRSDRVLAAIGLLYGLSFGNHMSTLLLAPGIGLFLLIVAGRDLLQPRRILLLAGPFALGLSIYLYIPLRYLAQPQFNYAGHYDATGQFIPMDMTRLKNIWWLISGQGFQGLMFDYSASELLVEIKSAIHRLWGNFLGIGILPGLLGAWIQVRRRPKHFLLLSLTLITNAIFFINYRVVDKEVMFLPVYLIWAVWVAEGFTWLIQWVQDQRSTARNRTPAWAWGLAILAMAALVINWPLVDVRHDSRARERAEAILSIAGPDAIVFGWWTSAPPMHYLQIVENQRSDVLVINRFLIGAEEMYALIDRSLGKRPVYTVELDEGLVTVYRAIPLGPVFELTPRQVAGVN